MALKSHTEELSCFTKIWLDDNPNTFTIMLWYLCTCPASCLRAAFPLTPPSLFTCMKKKWIKLNHRRIEKCFASESCNNQTHMDSPQSWRRCETECDRAVKAAELTWPADKRPVLPAEFVSARLHDYLWNTYSSTQNSFHSTSFFPPPWYVAELKGKME